MKKRLTILLAIAMLSTMMTACSGSNDSSNNSDETTTTAADVNDEESSDDVEDSDSDESADADTDNDAEEEETEAPVIVLPDGVEAESGDAYLAFGDGEWWLQYDGTESSNLSYGAEVAHIDGDGTYTVSIDVSNADAVSMNGVDSVSGCSFLAVIIKDGETLFPDQATAITIDSISFDGNEVEFTKNYCNYEDGHLRTNIFNSYVSEAPTEDVWTADGDLTDISAQIIPASTFDTAFSKIEVTFTITSTGDSADADSADDADANTEDEDVDVDSEEVAE